MPLEKQEIKENPDTQKFMDAFKNELKGEKGGKENEQKSETGESNQNTKLDEKTFNKIIDGVPYNDSLSKEENFKNAFDKKISKLIDDNLKNLPPDTKDSLKSLQKEALDGKNPENLIEAFKEIESIIGTRNAESYKSRDDKQFENANEQRKDSQNKLQEFLDKLKEAIQESYDKEKKRQEKEQKQRRVIDHASKIQQTNAENVLTGFPVPEAKNQTV